MAVVSGADSRKNNCFFDTKVIVTTIIKFILFHCILFTFGLSYQTRQFLTKLIWVHLLSLLFKPLLLVAFTCGFSQMVFMAISNVNLPRSLIFAVSL